MRTPSPSSLGRSGQFIPMAAMIIFTVVVFLVAVVNVYQVARVKLKVQNLADAAALNVASQVGSSLNKMADLNEWMNHFIELSPNGPSKPGDVPDCVNVNPDLPPLACAENASRSQNLNVFTSINDAKNYAKLVQTINKTQDLFAKTYNNFIGAGVAASGSGASNLASVLVGDIPELAEEQTTYRISNVQSAFSNTNSAGLPTSNSNQMQDIKFKTYDVPVSYWYDCKLLFITKPKCGIETKTLGELAMGHVPTNDSQKVGWKELDTNLTPTLRVPTAIGQQSRIGVSVKVSRPVQIMSGMTIPVSAESVAYVVSGSGVMGDRKPDRVIPNANRPVFKPTYWVKLVGAK